jgi:hypothetical protein
MGAVRGNRRAATARGGRRSDPSHQRGIDAAISSKPFILCPATIATIAHREIFLEIAAETEPPGAVTKKNGGRQNVPAPGVSPISNARPSGLRSVS